MGLSSSKPAASATAGQLVATPRDNARPSVSLQRSIQRSPSESPVSPTSQPPRRGITTFQMTRPESSELERAARNRRESQSGTVVATDEGATAVGSLGLQPLYGHPWPKKPQSPLFDRVHPQRSESGPFECKNPITGDLVFEIQPIQQRSSLRIICPLLGDVLRQVSISPYGDSDTYESFSTSSTIIEPYQWLFHKRERIRQVAKQDPGKHTSRHAELLLDFVKAERPTTWEKLDEIEAKDCRNIAFDDIWLIYPRGATVFAKDQGGWRAYKVERTESSPGLGSDEIRIHCLFLDLDATGKWLTPKREVLTVHRYSSELPIRDIGIVPDWHFQRLEDLTGRLMERGRLFWEYSRDVNHKTYHGQAWPRSVRQDSINIIIDYMTSSKHTSCVLRNLPCASLTCLACLGGSLGLYPYPANAPHDFDICTKVSQNGAWNTQKSSQSINGSFLFCPSRLWAFSLRHKSWELILPEDVGDVQIHDNALDRLVMKDRDMGFLESAVNVYCEDRSIDNGDSATKGTRSGFTILLHGNPGTGKTFTAECFAAKHGIPLYKITCADLGTDLEVFEKRLQETSLRAANWKAIVLLDDADMFIRARDAQDLRQYAIVSSFLHHLDDSEALLFITSTGVIGLDPALESRVKMPIQLPDFDFEAQKKIWKDLISHLEDLPEAQKKVLDRFIEFDLKAAENGVYTSMNGRQIKTCITAAVTLASKEKESLDIQHIRQMLSLGREFRELMQGNSDDPHERHEYIKRMIRQTQGPAS
ncbi:P-loop containing nucleoside triphosphate hydrolase protein [Astrocystis sublimbata]|nr:P-loop containing nucleoside triphosphate hydrolase protein [Astrocystis sublimbata]